MADALQRGHSETVPSSVKVHSAQLRKGLLCCQTNVQNLGRVHGEKCFFGAGWIALLQ